MKVSKTYKGIKFKKVKSLPLISYFSLSSEGILEINIPIIEKTTGVNVKEIKIINK